METFKCMIDSGDRKISFPNEKLVLPLLDVNQKVSKTVGLFLQRKLTIPAESEVEVMVYIASGGVGDNPVVGTWLVERGQTSGMLRLATPVFGISNNSNFNHYKVPHFLKDGCYSYVSLYQMFVQ